MRLTDLIAAVAVGYAAGKAYDVARAALRRRELVLDFREEIQAIADDVAYAWANGEDEDPEWLEAPYEDGDEG